MSKPAPRKLSGDDLITNTALRLERAAQDYANNVGHISEETALHRAAIAYAVTLLSVRGGLTPDEA